MVRTLFGASAAIHNVALIALNYGIIDAYYCAIGAVMNILTLEAWLGQAWKSIATLTDVGGVGARGAVIVQYDLDHALAWPMATNEAAVSATIPVALTPQRFDAWPGFLCDLLPQGEARRRLAKHLNLAPHSGLSDWALLAHGAGNPIGHLRIREAHQWLCAQPTAHCSWTLDQILSRETSFLDALDDLGLSPQGSTQGEWPKILLAEDAHGQWHLDHDLESTRAVRHWIVKLARHDPDGQFDLILRGEAAYHGLAVSLGMSAGEVRYQQGALFIERFDRSMIGDFIIRTAQESLYSAAGCTGIDPTLNHLQACTQLAKVVSDVEATLLDYVWRDVLNLALGNRDNHGRNTAIHREGDRIALSPVFDLAPMLLHPDGISRRMRWCAGWGEATRRRKASTSVG